MNQTYQVCEKDYAKRPKHLDFKKLHRVLRLRKTTTGQFELYRETYNWVLDPVTKRYNKPTISEHKFATISADNTITFEANLQNNDNQAKNLIEKLTGLWVWSDTSRFAKHNNALRIGKSKNGSYPMVAGTKFSFNTREFVHTLPDQVKVADKDQAKEISKFVTNTLRVMDVMARVGAFPALEHTQRWQLKKTVFNNIEVRELTEDVMALLAEHAYMKATFVTEKPYVHDTKWDYKTGRSVSIPEDVLTALRNEAEEKYKKNFRANARKHLTEFLREQTGAYKLETI